MVLKTIFNCLPFPKLKLLVARWNEQATWTKVQISYNGGAYSALVKQTGTVTTKLKSGDDVPLTRVNQYAVEKLLKID